MEEPRERAWTPAGAVRVGANNVEGTALGGTAGAHPSGEEAQRRGEVEAMEAEARGTFTPKPWSQDGGTGEFFDGVRFPWLGTRTRVRDGRASECYPSWLFDAPTDAMRDAEWGP